MNARPWIALAALALAAAPAAAAAMTLEQALELLRGKDTLAVEDAVAALVEIGPPAVPQLLPLLSDSEPRDARAGAIEALGKIGDRQALQPLLDLLGRLGPVPGEADSFAVTYLRTETLVALGGLGDPAAVPVLETATAGPDPFDQVHALTALARLGAAGALERLAGRLDPGQLPEIRALAVRGLGMTGGEAVVRPLLDAMNDQKWYVRDGAAEALGKIGDRRALERMELAARDDPSALVQRTAAEAVKRLGGKALR